MKILDREIAPIGMGCWAIGGPFHAGGESWAYSTANDTESVATIHAAVDAGIQVFDTAPAYGAGHSERLLGKALKGNHDVVLVSKLGLSIDEKERSILGEDIHPQSVPLAVDATLERLQRDRLDVMFLHLNTLAVEKAQGIFEALEKLVTTGKVGTYGWSTDFPANVDAMASEKNFTCVEHAMNIFMDVPTIQATVQRHQLTAFIRSPLAMGVLTGKYTADSVQPSSDIRASGAEWLEYYHDARPSARYLKNLEALRELLQSDGRTLTQGALCWLLSKSDDNLPIPGARTPAQIVENAAAMQFGPFSDSIMHEMESLIDRPPEGDPRER